MTPDVPNYVWGDQQKLRQLRRTGRTRFSTGAYVAEGPVFVRESELEAWLVEVFSETGGADDDTAPENKRPASEANLRGWLSQNLDLSDRSGWDRAKQDLGGHVSRAVQEVAARRSRSPGAVFDTRTLIVIVNAPEQRATFLRGAGRRIRRRIFSNPMISPDFAAMPSRCFLGVLSEPGTCAGPVVRRASFAGGSSPPMRLWSTSVTKSTRARWPSGATTVPGQGCARSGAGSRDCEGCA